MQSAATSFIDHSAREAATRLPRAFAFRHDVLPIAFHDDTLDVAVVDASDRALIDAVRRTTRLQVGVSVIPRDAIREGLRRLYDTPADKRDDAHLLEAPAVRFADRIFARAIAAHASDVHVEPRRDGGFVRLRIDGILVDLEPIPAQLFPALISRIKLSAGMDIADRRQPQDGRFSFPVERRAIDARVSSIPALDGEKLVVRLLDMHAQTPHIGALGMPAVIAAQFADLVRSPWGFVVVSGPTGSGKTTTAYASLGAIDLGACNVCSVEDPVERRLPGVTQVGVNPRAGVTFAGALRSFMRQDPNVVLVGEMRDAETAGVAIAASLAGQLVLTTLHSNDAPRTVERLVELGVSRASLAAGLTAVMGQRLVRRLCERCRQAPCETGGSWHARGCAACANSGYSGRIGVYELLVVDDELRDAIAAGASSVSIRRLAATRGYRPMLADALEKVRCGITSLDEVRRVVGGVEAA